MSSPTISREHLLAYLPDRLVRRVEQTGGYANVKRSESLIGTIVFADVADFTPISTSVARMGQEGNEELVKVLTDYYNVLIEEIRVHGGSVYQFAGDSVLIAFELGKSESPDQNIRRALTAVLRVARKIQKFNTVHIISESYSIHAKIGVSHGHYEELILGNENHFFRTVITGDAVKTAVHAQGLARGGQIVACKQVASILPASCYVDLNGIQSGPNETLFAVVDRNCELQEEESTPVQTPPDLESHQLDLLQKFIDPVILKKVIQGYNGFIYDHRDVSSVLIRVVGQESGGDRAVFLQELNDYYNVILNEARIFGGVVIQVDLTDKGNVFFVLFNAPVAVENKELAAARMAYRLLSLGGDREKFGRITNVEIGITTGLAFCGDLGARIRRGYTVIGDNVNLATRLMSISNDWHIHVDKVTADRIKQYFLMEPLENQRLKGLANPITVYRIISEADRLDGYLEQYTNEFVGRKAEFEKLITLLERTKGNYGQICSLIGENGIGKSRLLSVLLNSPEMKGVDSYPGFCYPQERHTPYFAWKEILRLICGVREYQEGEINIANLQKAVCERADYPEHWVAPLGNLLGFQLEEIPFTATLEARQKNAILFELIFRIISRKSIDQPVLLIMEDAQWIDEISLDLLKHIAARINNLPIMILLLHRPSNLVNKIRYYDHYNRIELNTVRDADMRGYLDTLLSEGALTEEQKTIMVQKAGGNPLFLEMLVRDILDRGLLKRDNSMLDAYFQKSGNFHLPSGLQDVILSRIDSLAPLEKAVIKSASVIGAAFDTRTLKEIMPLDMHFTELQRALAVLESLEFIVRDNTEKDAYQFKNVAMYEVAYNTLLRSTREELHYRAAEVIRKHMSWNREWKAEVIARHYQNANRFNDAIEYLILSGKKANREYDNKDAIFHLEKAAGILQEHGVEVDPLRRVEIYELLGEVYRYSGNYETSYDYYHLALEEVENSRASSSVEKARLARRRTIILLGMGRGFYEQGSTLEAKRFLEQALRGIGVTVPRLSVTMALSVFKQTLSYRIPGSISLFQGFIVTHRDLARLRLQAEILNVLTRVYFHEKDNRILWAILKGLNNAIRAREQGLSAEAYSNYGTFLLSKGKITGARQALLRALSFARQKRDPVYLAMVYQRLGLYAFYQDRLHSTIRLQTRQINLLRYTGEQWEVISGHIVLGFSHLNLGRPRDACTFFQAAVQLSASKNIRLYHAWSTYWLAFAKFFAGDLDPRAAREMMKTAKKLSRESRDVIARVQGLECLLPIYEENPVRAARMSSRLAAMVDRVEIIMPQIQFIWKYIGRAANYALRSDNLSDGERRKLESVARKACNRALYYSRTMPALKAPGEMLKAELVAITQGTRKAQKLYENAIQYLRESNNRWELALGLEVVANDLHRPDLLREAIVIFEDNELKADLNRIGYRSFHFSDATETYGNAISSG